MQLSVVGAICDIPGKAFVKDHDRLKPTILAPRARRSLGPAARAPKRALVAYARNVAPLGEAAEFAVAAGATES